MKQFTTTLTCWLLASALHAQLTLVVSAVPASTPPEDNLYVAGNFNSWNPGDPTYQLTSLPDGTHAVTLAIAPGLIEYKFTRGSWDTVEGTVQGGYIPNRTYAYTGGMDTVTLSIAGWEDGGGHTATPNVHILDNAFYMPQLDRSRRIWIYLPPDYETSGRAYPVLYLQDGQNLFDAATSFAGEWEVDESMNQLVDLGDPGAIIVGIDNGGSLRIQEYSPWAHPNYGGGDGELYAAFLAQTLKPYIDSQYRTRPEAAYTGVGGSSLGALIAMYTVVEYPEVFGKALIFSPSFWFSDSTYLHVAEAGITEPMRVYFAAGTNESPDMVPDMIAMRDLLLQEGAQPDQLNLLAHPDGAHQEWYWRREYPDAYTWLFQEPVAIAPAPDILIRAPHPNPANDEIFLDATPGQSVEVSVLTPWGQLLTTTRVHHGRMDIAAWPAGVYFLQLILPHQQVPFVFKVIKQ